ncbi:MAG: hypothetical protein G01um101438_655 [Parcubacteria group bacterium Gr01-1014_38]|nr:MAG: hypothetical protein G01um101438_655 [Parcubacteria group bacterium Gr01-1014_38]
MDVASSRVVAPDRVREETALAPLLLQTQGLIVDLLKERLGMPLSVKVLRHEIAPIGLVREGLMSADDIPLYLATTVIFRLRETQKLIQTLKVNPQMFFGDALKKHHLYHHKTPPTIRRSVYLPAYRALFGANGETSHVWERTYAIVTPKGKKIAGVTEIFSPKLEALLKEPQKS